MLSRKKQARSFGKKLKKREKNPLTPEEKQTQESLEDRRYQAQQAFQRGSLDREQAYGVYGLDADGNPLK